jgi:hypothetical protein
MLHRPPLQDVFANEREMRSGVEQESILVCADSDLDPGMSARRNIRAEQSLALVRNATGRSNRQHLLWIIENNLIVFQRFAGEQPLHGIATGETGRAYVDKGLTVL